MQEMCNKAETESLLLNWKATFFNQSFFNSHIFILIICEKICVSKHVYIHMQYLRQKVTDRYDLHTIICFYWTREM